MRGLPLILLLDREAFWGTLKERSVGWAEVASMAAFVIFSCAIYGAVMAGMRSPTLAIYVAAKLPLLFVGSAAIVAMFNWMVATTLGSGLSLRDTIALTFASMTVACWILLALAPVAAFFIFTIMQRVGEASAKDVESAYRLVLLTHVAALALAGVAGNAVLFKGLRAVVRQNRSAAALFAAWIALFAIVGCQLSWILRPFVGNPFLEVAFLRADALKGNFFEFVFGHLIF